MGVRDNIILFTQRRVHKKLPGYPDGAIRAAGKRLLPGHLDSKIWIAGKIFPFTTFFGKDFSIQVNLIKIFEAEQPGRQVGGKFQ